MIFVNALQVQHISHLRSATPKDGAPRQIKETDDDHSKDLRARTYIDIPDYQRFLIAVVVWVLWARV